MLQGKGITKSYGLHRVLVDVDISVIEGRKAALVGANGVGKSTLLRILAGLDSADSGEVEASAGTLISCLPQEVLVPDEVSIMSFLREFTGIKRLETRIDELAAKLNDPKAATEYSELEDTFTRMDGYSFAHRARAVLCGLGLGKIAEEESVMSLSGGQRSKVALAGVLLKGVDILLLDEPTNNLDLPALIWLEEFLRQSKAGVLLISHDRQFVDRVVEKTHEIDWKTHTLSSVAGGYTDFVEHKRRLFESQVTAYNLQQQEIQRLEDTAREKKQWAMMGARQMTTDNDKFARGAKRDWSARIARKGKAIEQQIERIEKLERPIQRPPLTINFLSSNSNNSSAIQLRDVTFSYSHKFSIGPITLDIEPRSRLGIVGLNGSGKSTLLKLISGELKPLLGDVAIGTGVIFGHLTQHHSNLPRECTLFDFIASKSVISREDIYNLLVRFHFDSGEASKRIGTLSPGGRARLLLALFAVQGVNMLLLDEPTNHLDIEAMEALEEVLKTFSGSVVTVSHDRYFLNRCRLSNLMKMEDGKLVQVSDLLSYEKSIEHEAKRMLKML